MKVVIQRTVLISLLIILGALFCIVIADPMFYPPGTFVHLDGRPSIMDHDWSPYGIGGWAYAAGDFLCHQEYSRSFILNGSQLPFCIRDIGLMIGFLVGLALCIFRDASLKDVKYLKLGAFMLLPTLIQWCIEHFMSIDLPVSRFLLAVISGIGASFIVGHALYRIE